MYAVPMGETFFPFPYDINLTARKICDIPHKLNITFQVRKSFEQNLFHFLLILATDAACHCSNCKAFEIK